MIFYHFTSKHHLPGIAADGLSRGDVPITRDGPGAVGVWLTTDSTPTGHGLPGGEDIVHLTPEQRVRLGVSADEVIRSVNKQAVRFKIKLPSSDRRLSHWPRWARKRLAPDWYATLTGASGHRSETWWIFWGVIPPSELLDPMDLERGEPLAGWPDDYLGGARG